MPTPDEKKILQIIDDEGGETKESLISREMGLRLDYLRSILGSMGRRDYIDVLKGGKVTLIQKGWKALGKRPKFSSPWEALVGGPDETPSSPEEKYLKWTGQKIAKEGEEESESHQ